MAASLETLRKMIELEVEDDYENKAVIGGLDGVLAWWPQQARQQCQLAQQCSLIDEIVDLIRGYRALDRAGRVRAIAEIKEKLVAIASIPLDAPTEAGSTETVPEAETLTQSAGTAGADGSFQTTPPSQSADIPEVPTPEESEPELAISTQPTGSRSTDTPAEVSRARATSYAHQGLDSPVTAISGIGPTQAKRLRRLGVETIGDLLFLFPRRHDDYSQLKPIGKLSYGEQVTIIGTIRDTRTKRRAGGVTIVNTIVADASGSIQATWFNQPYLASRFKRGRQIVLSGQVDEYLGRLVMTSPTWEPLEAELLHTGRLVPVYPLTSGIKPRWLRRIMKRTVDYWTKRLPDHLPTPIRERNDLMPLEQAVYQIHFPDDAASLAGARRRLVFDEFFVLQIGVLGQRQEWRDQPGIPVLVDRQELATFLDALPYQLTEAQERALEEILADIAEQCPMSRLMQGDVGSGKTAVAMAAMYLVVRAGYQAAMMAPTEILAEQHFHTVSQTLGELGLNVALLTGSVPQAEREAVYAGIASGEIQIVVGTHALIQEGVDFPHLALAIVDEQHRFGVRQRGLLRGKGYNPHMLVMSATPIPRTLALTAYGDLDLSLIDEMPPGRQPIRTKWFAPGERERAYRFVRSQVQKGRQAYVICPLVEESGNVEAKAATVEHERLQKSVYPDLRVGLLHGRLKSVDKEKVMRAFGGGEIDILVSTSVVEVGIDVPNATVMLIEGANHFGLAQLHQFRGRVGRGEHESFCILLADATTDVSEERLRAIEETQDGFELAERDLEMRGPGDFFGTRQSGLPELKLASLGNTTLLDLARSEAKAIFAQDPALKYPDHRLLARRVEEFWHGEGDLS
jgi:ATP-dependent DNA helicase RecG